MGRNTVVSPRHEHYFVYLPFSRTRLETAIGAVSRTKSFEASAISENTPKEISMLYTSWPNTGLVEIKNLTISYKLETG